MAEMALDGAYCACLAILALFVHHCTADYPCLCSQSHDSNIYEAPGILSSVIETLYAYDCRPLYTGPVSLTMSWRAVLVDHKIGYVSMTPSLSVETCHGNLPSRDILTPLPTTTKPTTTTTPTPATVTRGTPTPTPIMATTKSHHITHHRKTTTKPTTTTTPTPATVTRGTPTPTPIMATTRSHHITHHRKTTAKPTTTQHSTPAHTSKPRVCPQNVRTAASHNHGYTGVYGNICYELVGHFNYPWQYAETNCRHKGGHLVNIQNEAQQTQVVEFLRVHKSTEHSIWTGLNDRHSEGHFKWTSDRTSVPYTNWHHGYTMSHSHHSSEDCVVLQSIARHPSGSWDDINCNSKYSWICQYQAVHKTAATVAPTRSNHNSVMSLFNILIG